MAENDGEMPRCYFDDHYIEIIAGIEIKMVKIPGVFKEKAKYS